MIEISLTGKSETEHINVWRNLRTNESNIKMFVYSVVCKIDDYILPSVVCIVDVLIQARPWIEAIPQIQAGGLNCLSNNVASGMLRRKEELYLLGTILHKVTDPPTQDSKHAYNHCWHEDPFTLYPVHGKTLSTTCDKYSVGEKDVNSRR